MVNHRAWGIVVADEMLAETLTDAQGTDWMGDVEKVAFTRPRGGGTGSLEANRETRTFDRLACDEPSGDVDKELSVAGWEE